jgi:hypothetical protein
LAVAGLPDPAELEAKAAAPEKVRQPETLKSFLIDSRRVTAFSKFIILTPNPDKPENILLKKAFANMMGFE